MRRAPHAFRSGLDGSENILVASAAAGVPSNGFLDLLVARVRILPQQLQSGHQKARRTISALQAVAIRESLLQWMQLSVLLESLHGGNLGSIGLHREGRARLYRAAVEQHRAGSAIRRVASDVCPGKFKRLPQEFDQQLPRIDFASVLLSVDRHSNWDSWSGVRHTSGLPPRVRRAPGGARFR